MDKKTVKKTALVLAAALLLMSCSVLFAAARTRLNAPTKIIERVSEEPSYEEPSEEPSSEEPSSEEPSTEPTTEPEGPECKTTGNHTAGAWTDNGDGTHSSACTACGEPMTETCVYPDPAVYTPAGDGKHAQTCTVCGGKALSACVYGDPVSAPPTQTMPGTLTRTCRLCGDQAVTETDAPEATRAQSKLMGDVTGDGKTDSEDARRILRAVVELEPIKTEYLPFADMDGDGQITAADARLALRTAVELEDVHRHEATGKLTKQPTCTGEGSMTWKCAYCLAQGTLTVPANGHVWAEATPKAAKHCTVCNAKVTGWYDLDGSTYYYQADGSVQKGKTLFTAKKYGVKGTWYLENGKFMSDVTGVVTANGDSRYVKNGKVDESFRSAVTCDGTDWLVTGGKAEKVTTAKQRTLFLAYGEVAKATTPDMTMEQKLRACFVYCKKNYPERRPRTPHYLGTDWPIIYANDMFAGPGGNCCSYAAAFAFMAKAIGYENVYACNSGGHGWAEINGLVYDPEWSKRDGLSAVTYYALSYDARCDVRYKAAISPGEPWMHVKI